MRAMLGLKSSMKNSWMSALATLVKVFSVPAAAAACCLLPLPLEGWVLGAVAGCGWASGWGSADGASAAARTGLKMRRVMHL